MGLDISSKSKIEYSAGYSGLHLIRYLAYKYCGGEKEYADFMGMQDGIIQAGIVEYGINEGFSHIKLREPHFDEPYIYALDKFRNLFWHSDSSGEYTKDGKTPEFGDEENEDLLTGNSVQLLKELEILDKNRETIDDKNQKSWKLFDTLYSLVKDTVENYDGRIAFH